jgi:hypothetical protein
MAQGLELVDDLMNRGKRKKQLFEESEIANRDPPAIYVPFENIFK